MKKVQLLSTFLFVCAFMKLTAQNSLDNSVYFNNDSLTYRLGLITQSHVSKKKDRHFGYFVTIDMPMRIKNKLLKKDISFWIEKLTIEKSDWATNIVLYYIYAREALVIVAAKNNRQNWLPFKKNEIEYWEKVLR